MSVYTMKLKPITDHDYKYATAVYKIINPIEEGKYSDNDKIEYYNIDDKEGKMNKGKYQFTIQTYDDGDYVLVFETFENLEKTIKEVLQIDRIHFTEKDL